MISTPRNPLGPLVLATANLFVSQAEAVEKVCQLLESSPLMCKVGPGATCDRLANNQVIITSGSTGQELSSDYRNVPRDDKAYAFVSIPPGTTEIRGTVTASLNRSRAKLFIEGVKGTDPQLGAADYLGSNSRMGVYNVSIGVKPKMEETQGAVMFVLQYRDQDLKLEDYKLWACK